jgi:histidyl-tRNA synthetase
VFGVEEVARGEVIVKSLRDGRGEQTTRPVSELSAWAQTLQSNS